MTKNIFCLNFWKMLVPLTSMGNPGTGETVFKAEDRSANFEVLLGYANGISSCNWIWGLYLLRWFENGNMDWGVIR